MGLATETPVPVSGLLFLYEIPTFRLWTLRRLPPTHPSEPPPPAAVRRDAGSAGFSGTVPILHSLLRSKRETLQRLWTAVGVSEDTQSEFLHNHLSASLSSHIPKAVRTTMDVTNALTFKSISKEVLRVLAVRWLGVRLSGLISQREQVLQTLARIGQQLAIAHRCISQGSTLKRIAKDGAAEVGPTRKGDLAQTATTTKSSSRSIGSNKGPLNDDGVVDLKAIMDDLQFQLQVYRTVSVYVVEYILSICTRTNSPRFYWTPPKTAARAAKLSARFQPPATPVSSSLDSSSGDGVDYLSKMAQDLAAVCRNSSALRKAIRELQYRISPMCLPINPGLYADVFDGKAVPPKQPPAAIPTASRAGARGAVQSTTGSTKPLAVNPHYKGSEDVSFLITEVRGLSSDPSSSPSDDSALAASSQRLTMRTLRRYIELAPLLVSQTFRDRKKRRKKYSESLFAVRHEDLLRQAGIDPFDSVLLAEAGARGGGSDWRGDESSFGMKRRRRKNRRGRVARTSLYPPLNLWKEFLRIQECEGRILEHFGSQ